MNPTDYYVSPLDNFSFDKNKLMSILDSNIINNILQSVSDKLVELNMGIEILDAARAAGNRPLSAEEEAVRAQLLAALVPIKGLHAAEDDSIAQIEAATTEADLFALFP